MGGWVVGGGVDGWLAPAVVERFGGSGMMGPWDARVGCRDEHGNWLLYPGWYGSLRRTMRDERRFHPEPPRNYSRKKRQDLQRAARSRY